jgi:hypothetical protein
MTMQHQIHPDDERLAALAGGDADASADAGLRAHVSACDRCGPMVAELAQLRSALAELPDLVPSRPLQLVPPVPATAQRAQGGWLRRLAAPMLAAGAMLVLVGTVGGSGVLSGVSMGLGSAAAPSVAASFAEDQAGEREVRDRFPFPVNLFFAFRSRDSRGGTPELSGGLPSPADASSGSGGSKASHQPAATEQPAPSHAPAGPPEASAQAVLSINGWGVVLLVGALGVLAGAVMLLTTRPAGP